MRYKLATGRRVAATSLVCAAVFMVCLLLLPLAGSVSIDASRALSGIEPDRQILFGLRVPRVAVALLAGGALALSGVLFQALLRNALADSYTLGVSAGASFGAVCAISLGAAMIWPMSVAGALLVLLVVLGVASRGPAMSPFTLLMAGITVNSICMAGILFLHSVATNAQSVTITRWLMGGIESVETQSVIALAALVAAAGVYAFRQARNWNALAVGEEWAIDRKSVV